MTQVVAQADGEQTIHETTAGQHHAVDAMPLAGLGHPFGHTGNQAGMKGCRAALAVAFLDQLGKQGMKIKQAVFVDGPSLAGNRPVVAVEITHRSGFKCAVGIGLLHAEIKLQQVGDGHDHHCGT